MNISTELGRDIWHNLQEPGSYEWWYFDAEDQEQGMSLVCIWFAGFAFSPYYMDHYLDWKENGSDPPKALDYAAFSFQLYENGRESVNFIKEGPSALFDSSGNDIDVRFENNRFYYDGGKQSYVLEIAFDHPARHQKVTAKILFTVKHRYSYSKSDVNNNGRAPRHEWLLTLPRADVAGSLVVEDTLKKKSRAITVRAKGYHDHNLGIMPVHEYINAWYWGRAFSDKYDLVYYVIFFKNSGYKPLALCMLHDNVAGELMVHEGLGVEASGLRRGLFAPVHNRNLRFSRDDFRMEIEQEQVLDSGPFYLRYGSGIVLHKDGRNHVELRGISEFLSPGRLKLPVLRFFIRCRVWRDGVKSGMYDRYNFFKTWLHWFKR